MAVLLAFGLLEGMLALLGVRPDVYERDPYVGFSSRLPLFVESIGADGGPERVTARNRLAFFNLQRFPKRKAPGTFRIFSLGGSTTYGHPYDDRTSFNGWLRAYLEGLAPERVWEVVNAGGISYGSYRVASLMEELIEYEPDLFVIYTGHNEFLERRVYHQVTRPPALLRALAALASRSRTATLLERIAVATLLRKQAGSPADATLPGDPVTLLENTDGPTGYTRQMLQRDEVLAHYAFNLNRMLDIAASRKARVIFVMPASNLKDTSPFKSEHGDNVPVSDQQRWRGLYYSARQALTAGRAEAALDLLGQAEAVDPFPASLHFVRGRALEALGRFREARAAYERARDEDVCPLRMLSAGGALLRRVAAERQVPLVDFEALLTSKSPEGIPGATVFLDHVHPTVEGNRLLAIEILRTMEQHGWANPRWDRAQLDRVTAQVNASVDVTAHSLALMNLCKTLGWAGKREEAWHAAARAVELGPDLAAVRYEAGLAAHLSGRTNEALVHYRRATELNRRLAPAHNGLGVLLEDRGDLEGAIAQFRFALDSADPDPEKRSRYERNLSNALEKLRQR